MRYAMAVALSAVVAGCVSSPVDYGSSLSQQDPKWASPECQQARLAASDYATREKEHPGWGFGVLLGPYSMGMVAAVKEHEQQQRRLLARQMHLQCSSQPLPKELDFDPAIYAPKKAKYP
ncbi:MAG: hypothetical protein E5V92_07385 [Mesorhizobium sp.]|uniref:hypothetical protein n=1 Tax=unclassified Mesorhizobium TaxID=325217 RepID=UPI000F75166E|nr:MULTISPECIES: hypothetical protein [unclassified Mesorhizobium]AZO70432.1 hypothetical protein EJ067_03970 [Mesorhizobium sp. M1D.F.Ca.ET.043.01.1.1]RWA88023.1 MAG: hypothetical protein EOQ32_23490 [Mesorhizobium sp.]RWD60974.1 MAG: hypothetical protein EOS36_19300 [Mesorhizobium sp.]RWE16135.1 MAG: hypothetical protein EOS61_07345 [Mesorhizobium sp.]RWE31782.1 MAG: hypothetical protein EOS79_31615 [Mesorhizobium sp.]